MRREPVRRSAPSSTIHATSSFRGRSTIAAVQHQHPLPTLRHALRSHITSSDKVPRSVGTQARSAGGADDILRQYTGGARRRAQGESTLPLRRERPRGTPLPGRCTDRRLRLSGSASPSGIGVGLAIIDGGRLVSRTTIVDVVGGLDTCGLSLEVCRGERLGHRRDVSSSDGPRSRSSQRQGLAGWRPAGARYLPMSWPSMATLQSLLQRLTSTMTVMVGPEGLRLGFA